MTRRLAAILERLGLLVGAVAFACAAAEVVFRVQGGAPPWMPAPDDGPSQFMGPPAPGILDVLRPNSTGTFQGIEYTLNSVGVRGPEYGSWPAPGVFRIVIVGDSVTMGHGVRVEDAYPARIEAALNAKSDEVRYEVINLGLSNLNLASAVERLDRLGAAYHPDLVVYGFTMNDIEGPGYRRTTQGQTGKEYRKFAWRFLDSDSHLLRALWKGIVDLGEILSPPPGSYVFELYDNYFDNPAVWELFERDLGRIAEFAASRGICAHVLIHTHVVYMNFRNPFVPIYDRVAAAAQQHGMTVTKSLPVFLGHDERTLQVNPFFDPHPNAEGHRLHAQALLEGLADLPRGCWDKAHL